MLYLTVMVEYSIFPLLMLLSYKMQYFCFMFFLSFLIFKIIVRTAAPA